MLSLKILVESESNGIDVVGWYKFYNINQMNSLNTLEMVILGLPLVSFMDKTIPENTPFLMVGLLITLVYFFYPKDPYKNEKL